MKAISRILCRRLATICVTDVVPSLLSLCCLFGLVSRIPAADEVSKAHIVPQASVDPRPITVPMIDGTDLRFTRPAATDDLSQTKAGQVVQDGRGFMWFGTQYGLNRFDGYNFKVFVHDPRNPKSLTGAVISALFKDRQGRLWVGCEQFVDRFEGETEGFIHYPIRYATHISQDSAGTLWLASGEGLYSLDPSTGKIRRYSHDPAIPSSLPANEVKSSGEDRRGRFWVATSQGLHEFDRKTGRVTLHVPLREPLRELSFYEDHFGVFWMIHASGTGLAVFERETNTLTHYSFRERDPASSLVTGVMAMLEDRSGNLWFATQGAGLLKFDREHQRFIGYRNIPAKIESLAQDRLNSLFEDREGNIWAGFSTMGTNRFSTKPPLFKTFPYDLRNPHSKGETFVGAIYEDREGIVWIGTRDALNRIERKTDQYTFYRTAEPGIGSDVISIIEDRSGALWVGTFNQGLHLFNRRTGRFKTYRHDAANRYSLSNDIVARLVVDHNGALWAATWNGLNRFDLATERFTKYKPDTSGTDLYYIDLIQD